MRGQTRSVAPAGQKVTHPAPAPTVPVAQQPVPPAGASERPIETAKAESAYPAKTTTPAATIAVQSPAPATQEAPAAQKLVASLLNSGDEMLRRGDVLSARLYYERAATAGSGQGAINAGKTYDPRFLATIDAPGLKGDTAQALYWYLRASTELNDPDADDLIKSLGIVSGR